MFMDYMDYVDDDSMVMFTAGQAVRMNATLNGWRKQLFQAVPKFPGNLGPSKTSKPAVKKVQSRLRDHFHHPELKADGVYGPTHRRDHPGLPGAPQRRAVEAPGERQGRQEDLDRDCSPRSAWRAVTAARRLPASAPSASVAQRP